MGVHKKSYTPPPAEVKTAQLLKGRTARVLRQRFPRLCTYPHGWHLWNPNYYVGTAGGVTSVIERSIANQKTA